MQKLQEIEAENRAQMQRMITGMQEPENRQEEEPNTQEDAEDESEV
jgi:hypothetical protein